MRTMTLDAAADNLPRVLAFADEILEAAGCGPKAQMQIDLAVEEIFVNIAGYAYAPQTGTVEIAMEVEDGKAMIRFTDSGKPYDPLQRDDPDVTLSAEARQIGGLGIFLTKKVMDSIDYRFENSKNILTMFKTL